MRRILDQESKLKPDSEWKELAKKLEARGEIKAWNRRQCRLVGEAERRGDHERVVFLLRRQLSVTRDLIRLISAGS